MIDKPEDSVWKKFGTESTSELTQKYEDQSNKNDIRMSKQQISLILNLLVSHCSPITCTMVRSNCPLIVKFMVNICHTHLLDVNK